MSIDSFNGRIDGALGIFHTKSRKWVGENVLRNRPLSVWWKSLSGLSVELILTDISVELILTDISVKVSVKLSVKISRMLALTFGKVFQSRPLVERWDKIFFSVGNVTFEKNSRVRFPTFGCTKVLVTVTRVRKKIAEALGIFFELLAQRRLESGDGQKKIGRIENIFFRRIKSGFLMFGIMHFF